MRQSTAPQAGTVKDIATTTEGAVVQPGSAILTLLPLGEQHLTSPTGQKLQARAGMQVAVETHLGRRTVLAYLLSPVTKAVQEEGREK